MTTSTHPTLVGVFRDRAQAEQAMQALYDAGFQRDQIRYSGSGAVGGFFEGIKSLFTGPVATGGDLANDLTGMGLSEEEARYYANEYSNGHAIVAVKAPGREQEAMDIMHHFGSYEYSSVAGSQRPPVGSPEAPADYPQQPYSNAPQQTYTAAEVQAAAMANRPAPTTPNRPDTQTRFQDLRSQLEQTQNQLQEARTRLQAAKEREAELRAVRERETEYQETHKQLQDAQSQLQATLAELRETESRISQYNQ